MPPGEERAGRGAVEDERRSQGAPSCLVWELVRMEAQAQEQETFSCVVTQILEDDQKEGEGGRCSQSWGQLHMFLLG